MVTRSAPLCAGVAFAALTLPAQAAGPACATPDQAKAVRDLYATTPHRQTFMAAAELQVPESVITSGLPPDMAVGVAGSEFQKVWASLGEWELATTLLRQGPHVFEVVSRVPAGKMSDRPGSKFFNLEDGAALKGHLRPDQVAAIYAVKLVGSEGPLRAVLFLDQSGASAFGVFTGEGGNQPPAVAAQFEKTWALLKTLAPACPTG
jgi:putative heme iron utilization protein